MYEEIFRGILLKSGSMDNKGVVLTRKAVEEAFEVIPDSEYIKYELDEGEDGEVSMEIVVYK